MGTLPPPQSPPDFLKHIPSDCRRPDSASSDSAYPPTFLCFCLTSTMSSLESPGTRQRRIRHSHFQHHDPPQSDHPPMSSPDADRPVRFTDYQVGTSQAHRLPSRRPDRPSPIRHRFAPPSLKRPHTLPMRGVRLKSTSKIPPRSPRRCTSSPSSNAHPRYPTAP